MKMKSKSKSLAVWSPLPPAPSGIADYVAEQLPLLAKRFDLVAVAEDPARVDPGLADTVRVVAPAQARADLHVYHLGNSPAHAFVHRQARSRPGVVVLHEWSLHHLVLHETLERGDPGAYLGEMRRAYGELGSFVGRQVVRGLGGSLFPSLLPLNERLLESSLAAVTLTEALRPAVARRMSGRPVLALPLHFSSPLDPAPSREEARRVLGLPPGAFVICAPGLGTAAKRLDLAIEAAARMERGRAGVLLVVAGELDSSLALPDRARELGFAAGLRVTGRLSLEDFTRHLCAADVVLALRFPSYGEMSAALVRALGLGRPAFVTAGTPAALELPEGVGIPISPGAGEEDELLAFLLRLRDDQALGERLGEVSRDFVRARHDLPRTVDRLATFLDEVADRVEGLLANLPPGPEEVGTLPAYLKEELHWAARDLGVGGLAREVDSLVDELCGRPQGL